MQTFTHFVTFTYNGQLHTEETFKKCLKKTLANFASRKGWKYVGVWERSPEKQSLHFHGLLYIPEGTMPGLLVEKSDYSFKSRRISDVMDDDVVTTVGLEDKKLLRFDDFACWDEGEYMGKVSQEVIKQLRKSN